MRPVTFERFLWATVIGSMWFLTRAPVFAAVVPLSPWVWNCQGPMTDDGVVWYSRSYDEQAFGQRWGQTHVFRDANSVPVTEPNSPSDDFFLSDIDGETLVWVHRYIFGGDFEVRHYYVELYDGRAVQRIGLVTYPV